MGSMREYNTQVNQNSLSNRSASLSPTQDKKIINDDFTIASMLTQDVGRATFYPVRPSKFKQGSDGGSITNSPYFDGVQFQKQRILFTRGSSQRPSVVKQDKLMRIPNLGNKMMSSTQYGRFGQQREEMHSNLQLKGEFQDQLRPKGLSSFQCSISKQSDYLTEGSIMDGYIQTKDQTLPVLPQQPKKKDSTDLAAQLKRSSMTSNYTSFFSTSPQRNRGVSSNEPKQSGSSSPNYKEFRSLYKRTNFMPLKRKYSPDQYLSRKKDLCTNKLVSQTYLENKQNSVKTFGEPHSPSQSPQYRNFNLLPKSSSNTVKEHNTSSTNFRIQLLKVQKGKNDAFLKGQRLESAQSSSLSRDRNIYKISNSSPQPNSKKISSTKVNRNDGQIRRDFHQTNQQDQTDCFFVNSSLNSQMQDSPLQNKLMKINQDVLTIKDNQGDSSRLFEFRRISKPLLKPQKQSLFNEIRKSVERLKQEISIEDYGERANSGKESDFMIKDPPAYLSSAERKNRIVASRVLPVNQTIEPIIAESEVLFKKPPGTAAPGTGVSRRGVSYRKKMTIRDLEGGGGKN